MSASKPNEARQVIPRWRSFKRTLSTRELHATNLAPRISSMPEVDRLREEYKEEPSLYVAADLRAALLANKILGAEFEEVSSYISSSPRVPSLLMQSLQRDAKTQGLADSELDVGVTDTITAAARADVARLRKKIRLQPRDAISRVDIALSHAILGNVRQASREISVALSIAPDNRFILRSATRFYVHVDDPDQAHWILTQSPRTIHDPWLLSAELSTAHLASGGSENARIARELLISGRFGAHSLSELASEVATGELQRGSDARARKFFAQSLVEPTENAVAQAAWASENKTTHLNSESLTIDRGYEARAITWAQGGRWEEATEESRKWQFDQPFDLRAAMYGSYYASMGAQDYESALTMASMGLLTHPGELMLHNNAAFALANLGRTDEARVHLALLAGADDDSLPVFRATEGLVAFREGNETKGRRYYRSAVEGLLKASRPADAAAAALFWALEESRIDSILAGETRKLGERLLSAAPIVPETQALLGRLDAVRPSSVQPRVF